MSGVWTVADSDLLRGPAVMNGSARGTALVVLVVAVPVLLISMALVRRGTDRALLTWLGALTYLQYNAVLLLFLTPFNPAFPAYLAMLSAATWGLVAVLRGTDAAGFGARLAPGARVRPIAVFVWVVAALNAAAWLRQIVPALGTDEPAFLEGTGMPTNAIYIQDLAIWLPMAAAAGVWLWRRHGWGVVATGGVLAFWVIESIGIAVDQMLGHRADPASEVASTGAAALFAVLAVVTLLPLGVLLRSVPDPPRRVRGPGRDGEGSRAAGAVGVRPAADAGPARDLRGVEHRVMAGLAALMAIAGYAGAVGLAGGGIDLGATIVSRLPFDSTVLAGAALLLAVAVPMTGLAVAAWLRSPSAARIAVAAGLILVAWIVVEYAVIRSYSWMQPFCLGYGALIAVLGLMLRGRPSEARSAAAGPAQRAAIRRGS